MLVAGIGFCISLYAYIIERKMKEDPTYKPACDISDRISCSKPMTSKYSNLFGMSNGLAGMLYYLLILFLAYTHSTQILFFATIVGLLTTFCFAYLLYFKIKSFCIVCTSIYIINIVLFLLSMRIGLYI
jgi:vitamin-K-epoxide reductase (warfarin-sensitive)